MSQTNPHFHEPECQACLWRYLDLPRLLDILQSRALYFCRLDKFDDPYEGSITEATLKAAQSGTDPWNTSSLPNQSEPLSAEEYRDAAKLIHNARTTVHASCWHMNDHDSEAMWKLYATDGKGIAIKSSLEGLKRSLSEQKRHRISYGEVNYINYEISEMPIGDALDIAFYKRLSFEHEKELRAVFQVAPSERGILVPCNLKHLIKEIQIDPKAPDWFVNVINNVCEKYDLGVVPTKSKLLQAPPWGNPGVSPN